MISGIILIGPSCSGKSTIGKEYSRMCDIDYISSGDIARMMAAEQAKWAIEYENGQMAQEDEMRKRIKMTLDYQIDNNIPFILDGFPRFIEQDDWLHSHFDSKILFIYVCLMIDYDECIARAERRGRPDDIYIYSKIRHYREQTKPIITRRIKNNSFNIALTDTATWYDLYVEVRKYVNNCKI